MYIHAILITYSFFQIPGKHFVFQTIVIAKEGIPVLIHLDKNILFFLIKSYEIQTLIFKKWVMVLVCSIKLWMHGGRTRKKRIIKSKPYLAD